MNGNTIEGLQTQIRNVRAEAAANGRTVKFGVNAFIVARETEQEARDELHRIIQHAPISGSVLAQLCALPRQR